MKTSLPSLRAAVAAVSFTFACAAAQAQSADAASYPTRPIRMVMPFAAGSGFDSIVRITCQKMGELLGQSVVVDNQGGAGGMIASAAVARAVPDGYTLIFHSVSTAAVLPAVYTNLKYDARSFVPVSLVSDYPLVMAVPPDVPAKNVAEFTALLKAKPNAYSYASSGVGTGLHLAAELYKSSAGVEIEHVPYKGTGPAEIDLLAGRTQMMFAALPSFSPKIKAGTLRALAVTTTTRSPTLPDVPTMIESGLAGFNVPFWNGIYAPPGTPKAIVDKLSAAAAKAMRDPATIAKLRELGANPIGSTPEELDKFWKEQLGLYQQIAQRANLRLTAQ
ncbi:MAG: tripartite tricarboxylate transporter substrate binding protein [Burkholderiales bacterium]|nr:tripartite tricarboxylate transporter substrate binding protein [Burkholderiales bacterium]